MVMMIGAYTGILHIFYYSLFIIKYNNTLKGFKPHDRPQTYEEKMEREKLEAKSS
jgi:hypothetical protein